MPAKGLTLVEVGYPPDEELAGRAEQTRGKRSLADRQPVD
jgi:tRNA pseudouridine38-40 synthase